MLLALLIGGQIIERMSNGVSLPWASSWPGSHQPGSSWLGNRTPGVAPTEVEIRFLPDGDGTRLELEHRGWERVGAKEAEVREAYGSLEGWVTTLNVFSAAIEREVA